MKRKPTAGELEHVNGQVCTYTCGLCSFAFTGRLDAWLTAREEHRQAAHPDFRERKHHKRSIGGAKHKTQYMTEREMVAA